MPKISGFIGEKIDFLCFLVFYIKANKNAKIINNPTNLRNVVFGSVKKHIVKFRHKYLKFNNYNI